MTKALSLLSGGLDSLLAIKVLQEQGIDVTGITFITPFFGSKNAEKGAAQLGIKLKIVDITEDHLVMLKNPPHGYGKQMNPCIDCHAMMIKKTGEILKKEGFDFISTGEVLGERPMSQNRQSLDVVACDSGCTGILLRPLSAKLLPPTKPEIEGLVDREKLQAIEGRSRKPQMELAANFGIKSYIQPAGGCLLTDPNFSIKLKELLEHDPNSGADDVRLLKIGRHFRLTSGAKAIVGRDKADNDKICEEYREGRVLIEPEETVPGPMVLLVGKYTEDDILLAAKLCASYSDNKGQKIELELRSSTGDRKILATPEDRKTFEKIKI